MTNDQLIAFFVCAPPLALTITFLTLGWFSVRRQ
jgi:hypothetical protein